MSRVAELFSSFPLVTCALTTINIAIHAFVFLFSAPVGLLAINPARVIYASEYYRVISSAFIHGGILHLLMNMMSLVQLGSSLENQFGSSQFLLITLWIIPLTGALYIACYWIAAELIFHQRSYLNQSAVGYSGILFAYALLESHLTPAHTRSIFGLFSVSSKVYPWILLIAIQVILPNISFVGHLSGLLVGVLLVSGYLNFLIPSTETYPALESSLCSFAPSFPNFISSSDKPSAFSSSSSSSSPLSSFLSFFSFLLLSLWQLFSLLCHIIGLPLDRYLLFLLSSCRQCPHWLAAQLSSAFSPTPGPTSYQLIPQHATHRPPPLATPPAPTTRATGQQQQQQQQRQQGGEEKESQLV